MMPAKIDMRTVDRTKLRSLDQVSASMTITTASMKIVTLQHCSCHSKW